MIHDFLLSHYRAWSVFDVDGNELSRHWTRAGAVLGTIRNRRSRWIARVENLAIAAR